MSESASLGNLDEARLRRINAADLQRQAQDPNQPRLPFLPLLRQSGFFVQGFSHLLSGFPKAGKTTLLTHLIHEWSQAGYHILYLTEEPQAVWLERLRKEPPGWENVNLVFALGSSRPDLLQAIATGKEEIVLIDTFRLLGALDENNNSEMHRVVTPFIAQSQNLAKTLIIAHHTNKTGGAFGRAASGGHALLGAVDVVLELEREGQIKTQRRVKGWGRVIEVPELIYEKQGKDLIPLGNPQDVALDIVASRLSSVLTDTDQTVSELLLALGQPQPSKDQVQKALVELGADGEVEREPPLSEGSKQGKTYKWRKAQTSLPTYTETLAEEVQVDLALTSSSSSSL